MTVFGYLSSIWVLHLLLFHHAAPTYGGSIPRKREITNALTKYGYYTSWAQSDQHLEDAIRYFQLFNGYPQTGTLDAESLNMLLHSPRCGLRDPIVRKKKDLQDYYLSRHSWKKQKAVTWHWDGNIGDKKGGLTVADVYLTLEEVFSTYSKATNQALRFKQKADKSADIVITFTPRHHRDPFPGDGRGRSIGHAFYPRSFPYPTIHGDIHFDRDDVFVLGPTNGTDYINFKWAALHEIGHALGLKHSHIKSSVMYSWYNSSHPVLALHQNDVEAISHAYPSMLTKTTTATNMTTAIPAKVLAATEVSKHPAGETVVPAGEATELSALTGRMREGTEVLSSTTRGSSKTISLPRMRTPQKARSTKKVLNYTKNKGNNSSFPKLSGVVKSLKNLFSLLRKSRYKNRSFNNDPAFDNA